jgi:two-component system LytT family response regulator
MNETVDLEHRIFALFEELKGEEKYLQWLFVKTNNRLILIDVNNVSWMEAQGNYVRIHHEQGSYLLRETISALAEKLSPRKFLRIHRSVIVQIDRIKEIQRWIHGSYIVTLRNGTQLTMTRNYRDNLAVIIGKAF